MSSDSRSYQLAIETTGRSGSVCLGRDGELLEVAELPAAKRGGGTTGGGGAGAGGSGDLMAAIDALCGRQGVGSGQLGEVYLSIGPGSFTGLRIAVATVKMMAQVLGVRVVAVPTLAVVAQNAPVDVEHLAVCLNQKRDTVYAGLFERGDDGAGVVKRDVEGERTGARSRERRGGQPRFVAMDEPALRTMAELLAAAPRPLSILGDPLPALPVDAKDVTVLPASLAAARAETVFALGVAAAEAGQFADPLALAPLYIRPPEAVTLWEKRRNEATGRR